MKFAEHLSAHITPEWRKQYINYEEMKAMLYKCIEQAPPLVLDPDQHHRFITNFDEVFFHYCEGQLTKINTFYSEKLAEAVRKYAGLQSELSECQHADGVVKGVKRLRLAFSEFYLSLVLLQNYQNLNFTGFRKILKKHDKLMSTEDGMKWRCSYVESSHFYVNKDTDRLIAEVEEVMERVLEGGNRARAMRRLRVPPLGQHQGPWTTFRLGFFTGTFLTVVGVVVFSGVYYRWHEEWQVMCRLLRGPLLLVCWAWAWAANIHGWRGSGVNHVLIFSLDPRHNLSDQHAAALAAGCGTLWGTVALLYLNRSHLNLPASAAPLIFYAVLLAFLLNPTKTFHYEGRLWFLKLTGRILLSPWFPVGFPEFWMAEQLTSLVPCLLDLHFTFCFTLYPKDYCLGTPSYIRTGLAMSPFIFRALQCLRRLLDTKETHPHVPNTIKYVCSFLLLLLASLCNICQGSSFWECAWVGVWLGFGCITAVGSYLWDVRMDWGLLESQSDAPFLRQETVYSSTWVYYFGLVEDLILRVCWVGSVSLTETGHPQADLIVTILAPLEVFRRFMWNFFRLENEHLNNCGKFRAVRDISVAPIESGDQAAIIRLMDQPGEDYNSYTPR